MGPRPALLCPPCCCRLAPADLTVCRASTLCTLGCSRSWPGPSWLLAPSTTTGLSLVRLHPARLMLCPVRHRREPAELAGQSTASSDQVSRFYTFWLNFVSDRSFTWADKYNLALAPNRLVRCLLPCAFMCLEGSLGCRRQL